MKQLLKLLHYKKKRKIKNFLLNVNRGAPGCFTSYACKRLVTKLRLVTLELRFKYCSRLCLKGFHKLGFIKASRLPHSKSFLSLNTKFYKFALTLQGFNKRSLLKLYVLSTIKHLATGKTQT
jgi:hypothetical protein